MNFIEEILRTVYSNAGTTPDDDEMAKVVDQAIQSQAEQPQVRRTYFRRVANEEPES